jgi:carboxyl-terminal processing protease
MIHLYRYTLNHHHMKCKLAHTWSILICGTLLLSLSSCRKDDDSEDAKGVEISQWIYDWMKEVYFWNSTLPSNVKIKEKTDPEAFFYELVYDVEDTWSFITDDWASLHAELSGTPLSMGYSPAFGLFTKTGQVFIIVEYVYPNSPASQAGLKRGDIILTINGENMDTTNYYDLYIQKSYTAGLGYYADNNIYSSGETVTMTATTFDADPLLYDTIYAVADKKIGYMVYSEFVCGDNNKYFASLDQAFDNFKAGNITDLIVDLRYNPGGEIDASGHLASAIAPASVVSGSSTFVTFTYNDDLQSYFEKKEGPESENLVYKFPANGHNIDLNHVYFLTTSNTASACELLIVGLRPYMNVTIVGEPTYGKFTGMWVIYDTDKPPKHNWAILPVVMKYANALGYTDFKEGLAPDVEVADNLLQAKPFGSADDPVLQEAVGQITGTALKTTLSGTKPGYSLLENNMLQIKRNLFVPNNMK